ncbi:hypothetical protein ABEB36_004415 [Hypothenemus hampei]|uniref:Uncharacterized protein n=1 Tax=Hypothenemus hampei TaxID=57062 RepID=A0ABD1F711_HYPHA
MNKRAGGGGSWNRRGKSSNKELTGMRRQRSLEWRNERDCSSSDDDITRPVESQIFASLLAQAQKEFKDDIERNYRSDETDDVPVTDDHQTPAFSSVAPTLMSPRSPISLHRQASPFPLDSISAGRRITYQPASDRLRALNVSGEVIYATGNKKSLSNNNTTTMGRSGRRHRIGGMTSSSSATSCNSNCNENILQPNGDIPYHEQHAARRLSNGRDEESPPEPAPPEIPPRGGSLHTATLRRRTEFQLASNGDVNCDDSHYIPSDFIINGSEGG